MSKKQIKKTIYMKNFLLALMVVLTTCTLAVAQNQKFRHGKRILLKFYSGSRCWMVSSTLYTSLLE